METMVIVTAGVALLAVVSGMLGLGVASTAIPFLGRSIHGKICLLARRTGERVRWDVAQYRSGKRLCQFVY